MTAGLENEMRGRRVLMDSLVAHGVRHIFGNPGTTETPLLDSLPAYPQVQYIMALHEGVAVGAASFYAQATRRPVVANVFPGFGRGRVHFNFATHQNRSG